VASDNGLFQVYTIFHDIMMPPSPESLQSQATREPLSRSIDKADAERLYRQKLTALAGMLATSTGASISLISRSLHERF